MFNNQESMPISQLPKPGGVLLVHSIFYAILDHGPLAGVPAVFVRLAGCNLQCPTCSTNHTAHLRLMGPKAIFADIRCLLEDTENSDRPLIVLTGGEPFRQNIAGLVDKLLSHSHRVQIETNGTLPPSFDDSYPDVSYTDVMIVCSPKKICIDPKLFPFIDAFSYLAVEGCMAKGCGLPYGVYLPPVAFTGPIFIQPLREPSSARTADNRLVAVKTCMEFGYTLCLS